MTLSAKYFRISKAVADALEKGQPVVALESTVLTHGLPYPQNFETLGHLENILLQEDVVPATIIVLDGIACVGMEAQDRSRLDQLMLDPTAKVLKLTMRDMSLALAIGMSGGTTVSATMRIACLAGIKVFATGGIGGVHRGWQNSRDISMDIQALATIPVTVISAGCKAILDIGATLEALETAGVPIWGWQTDVFPTFYSSTSAYQVDNLPDAETYVMAKRLHQEMSPSPSGILIANPIPKDYEISSERIEPCIQDAIASAQKRGISGKALTPFLLDYLAKTTEGVSVTANLALLENNVRLAAKLAKAEQE